MGAVGAATFATALTDGTPGLPGMLLIALGGILFGALWAAVAAVLKLLAGVNETISTLLLNYVATLILAYAVTGPLKDPEAANFPIGAPIPTSTLLPEIGDVHVGVIVAVLLAGAVGWLLSSTRWGFKARVAGGNPRAALRGGLPVCGARPGGASSSAARSPDWPEPSRSWGRTARLRQGLGVGFGFLGFLASWLAMHRAGWTLAAVFLIASISVGATACSWTSRCRRPPSTS